MSPILSAENLLAWFIQVSAIALVATALPVLLRVRHPKSQLAYYHVVLVLCFVVPFIQPWHHPILFASGAPVGLQQIAIPWASIIVGIVVAGIVLKICWLSVGLWQLRRYRRAALPLHPLPQSIQEARKRTGADALFCISKDVTGPATLGYIDPVVLLPESFGTLGEDEQRSVACHELLHVRRFDWLVIMFEEIAGALFWYNPPVRWLLAQVKLTREQVVDAEVVRLTARAPYIQALLSLAVVTRDRWAFPAAPFFTEGHLVHRMRWLLLNRERSRVRLSASYLFAALFVLAAGWSLMTWFPLMGEAQVVSTTPQPLIAFRLFIPDEENHTRPAPAELFNVRVPAPRQVRVGPGQETAADVHGGVIGGASRSDALLDPPPPPPAPPPPPPPGFRLGGPPFAFLVTQGIRIIRPGDRPSPEELERFIQGFPGPSSVEVIHDNDGTVRRITVQTRRLVDAANSIPFGDASRVGGQPPGAVPAESAISADGLH